MCMQRNFLLVVAVATAAAMPAMAQTPSAAGPAALPPSDVGIRNDDQLVGDYKSPILRPWAAEVVKRFGELSLAGITFHQSCAAPS